LLVACVAAQAQVGKTAMSAVTMSNNRFAFDLYDRLGGSGEGNVFLSPFSVSNALGMTLEGSAGETRRQMAAVLHLGETSAVRQAGFAALLGATKAGPDKHYQLTVANALWAQTGRHFAPAFLRATSKAYGGALFNVDFAGDAEGARTRINGWVAKQTADKIQNLIGPGVLGADTPLVLTNAIYFKGTWDSQFKKEATAKENFHVSAAQSVPVEMMHQTERYKFAHEDGWTAIEMAYKGGDLAMVALLKDAGEGKALTEEEMAKLRGDMRAVQVEVSLPRFTVETTYELNAALAGMGMADAFSRGKADFSGMDGRRDLYIGEVVHKARIEVNEEGSEAAAATAVVMKALAVWHEAPPEVFRADRPFEFFIVHNGTGAILFEGRVSLPTAAN